MLGRWWDGRCLWAVFEVRDDHSPSDHSHPGGPGMLLACFIFTWCRNNVSTSPETLLLAFLFLSGGVYVKISPVTQRLQEEVTGGRSVARRCCWDCRSYRWMTSRKRPSLQSLGLREVGGLRRFRSKQTWPCKTLFWDVLCEEGSKKTIFEPETPKQGNKQPALVLVASRFPFFGAFGHV